MEGNGCQFKILSLRLPEGANENHEHPQNGSRYANPQDRPIWNPPLLEMLSFFIICKLKKKCETTVLVVTKMS
jgi:hypothetical protein